MVAAIAASGRRPRREVLEGDFPVGRQEAFGKEAAASIGFDFDSGRLDAGSLFELAALLERLTHPEQKG